MEIRKYLKVNISKVVSLIRFSWKSEVGLPGCFVRKFVTNLVNDFAHNLVNITKLVTEIVTDFSHFPNLVRNCSPNSLQNNNGNPIWEWSDRHKYVGSAQVANATKACNYR